MKIKIKKHGYIPQKLKGAENLDEVYSKLHIERRTSNQLIETKIIAKKNILVFLIVFV
jgi:hypothetical protein